MGKKNEHEWNPRWLLETENVEHKRIIMQVCGYSRVMKELNSKLIHKSGDMELKRIDGVDIEPLMLLKVVCPSTNDFYALRVPPVMETCESAREWTMHYDEEPLELIKET